MVVVERLRRRNAARWHALALAGCTGDHGMASRYLDAVSPPSPMCSPLGCVHCVRCPVIRIRDASDGTPLWISRGGVLQIVNHPRREQIHGDTRSVLILLSNPMSHRHHVRQLPLLHFWPGFPSPRWPHAARSCPDLLMYREIPRPIRAADLSDAVTQIGRICSWCSPVLSGGSAGVSISTRDPALDVIGPSYSVWDSSAFRLASLRRVSRRTSERRDRHKNGDG
ncbi:hypothetical protein GGS23DRAFT_261333 [Durotheca rogersii]|uniref:uncharacterized protein n=1 Tax=Durotheca rogersii TaxID=419775 RepID=UPI00221F371A|nr:uncharacterized protein GGS23DRAFT_261333 [Durotheca rogersii]KAI5859791.1 hypothetical protein GGS23DRAFT_261333 [Durotheca rogersii]